MREREKIQIIYFKFVFVKNSQKIIRNKFV